MRPRRWSDAEILEVGRQVFLEHGPGATLQQVAERLHMTQPALSKRFGSKEAFLLRALAPDDGSPLQERLRRGPDQRPFDAQLRELCQEALELLTVVIPSVMTLRASGFAPIEAALAQPDSPPMLIRRALHAYFERAIALGLLRPCDPGALGDTLIGALEARALVSWVSCAPMGAAERAAHAAALVDLLWHGVRPEHTTFSSR